MEPPAFRNRTHILAETCITVAPGDAFDLFKEIPDTSTHAVITDPPYELSEYDSAQVGKLRSEQGGLWSQPPRGRSPLPRFTVLTASDRDTVAERTIRLVVELKRILVPGGHLVLAANSLMSSHIFAGIELSGLEKRGELIRIVRTLRGGDRPKMLRRNLQTSALCLVGYTSLGGFSGRDRRHGRREPSCLRRGRSASSVRQLAVFRCH